MCDAFSATATGESWTAVITAWRCNKCRKEFPSPQPHNCNPEVASNE